MARQRQAARSNEWEDTRQKEEEPREVECPPREKKPDETMKRMSNRCLIHANGKVSFLYVRRDGACAEARKTRARNDYARAAGGPFCCCRDAFRLPFELNPFCCCCRDGGGTPRLASPLPKLAVVGTVGDDRVRDRTLPYDESNDENAPFFCCCCFGGCCCGRCG